MNKKYKKVGVILAFSAIILSFTGCGLGDLGKKVRNQVPKDWYAATRDIYEKEFKEGWSSDNSSVRPLEAYKDKSRKFGYYLIDLDGDGNDEFLVGYDNGTKPTVFTDLYIWHPDVGSFRILNVDDGMALYLCTDKTIKMVDGEGTSEEIRYFKYIKEDHALENLQSGGEPMMVNLTYFD